MSDSPREQRNSHSRGDLAEALLALRLEEFIDVVRLVSERVGPGDRDGGWYIGGCGSTQRLVLAVAAVDGMATESGEVIDGECMLELVAYPTPEAAAILGPDHGPERGLWEGGNCPRCHAELTSQVKTALCPVCLVEAELT